MISHIDCACKNYVISGQFIPNFSSPQKVRKRGWRIAHMSIFNITVDSSDNNDYCGVPSYARKALYKNDVDQYLPNFIKNYVKLQSQTSTSEFSEYYLCRNI